MWYLDIFWIINFYRQFIKSFSKITTLLTFILKIISLTSTKLGCIKLNKNGLNKNSDTDISCKDIKNLSIIVKLDKSKKLDFIKIKFFRIDFLIFKAKKAFIYL